MIRMLIRSPCKPGRLLFAFVVTGLLWMSCEGEENPIHPSNDDILFSSYFEKGEDGWTSWENGETRVQWENACALSRNQEAGCISITDAQGGTMAFRAPRELRGGVDLSRCYGKQLKYWMRVSGGDSWREQPLEWNVMIESDKYGRLTMAFPEALQVDFPYRWQQVALNLSATPSSLKGRNRCWQMNGHIASEEEIRNVLSNVTNLLICADFCDGSETAYLDDVEITASEESVGPDGRICNGLPYLCDMPFDEIVFPGNHNSGSYTPLWSCSASIRCAGGLLINMIYNQASTITGQLDWGIRYFDIDICYCDGWLVNCHGHCSTGPSIRERLDQFDRFLDSPANRNEVIVITFADQSGASQEVLQELLSDELERWVATMHPRGELTLFTKSPGDPWPTLGYLVDSNRRIVVFVRDVLPVLENIGVLSERDYIHDTYKERSLTVSCAGVVGDTYNSCAAADPDKLVLITVNAKDGLSLKDLAGYCNPWIDECITACMEARATSTGKGLLEVTPNFIVADFTKQVGNMIGPVREMNMWILQENGFPISSSISLADFTAVDW